MTKENNSTEKQTFSTHPYDLFHKFQAADEATRQRIAAILNETPVTVSDEEVKQLAENLINQF